MMHWVLASSCMQTIPSTPLLFKSGHILNRRPPQRTAPIVAKSDSPIIKDALIGIGAAAALAGSALALVRNHSSASTTTRRRGDAVPDINRSTSNFSTSTSTLNALQDHEYEQQHELYNYRNTNPKRMQLGWKRSTDTELASIEAKRAREAIYELESWDRRWKLRKKTVSELRQMAADMDPRVFFPLGPPPFAPPPTDHALEIRIKKLAEFAARNGPAFIEEVRAKQSHNPEYAFLHGGEGAAYFFWVLHCNLVGQPPHQPAALLPPSVGQATAALPPQVRSGWSQVLSMLNGSKESITTSQAWFIACAPYAAGMAEMLLASADSAAAAGNYTAALHILWLVNDILFKAKNTRSHAQNTNTAPNSDVESISVAFKPYLGHLLRRVYLAADGDVEKQQAVAKVAHIWSEREVYPSQVVEMMVMEMMGVGAAAGQQPLPPPVPPPPMQLPPPPLPFHHQSMMQQHPRPPFPSRPEIRPGSMQTQPFPPPGAPQVPYRGGQEPKRPPPPPPLNEPEEAPFDPFSFPPGLIPRLVEENLQSQIPYSPLNPRNISASEVPPPPTLDPYLKARVDKFYAQLDGYKAGVDFSDIEGGGEPPIQRGNNVKTHPVPITAHSGGGGTGGGVDDGSGGFRSTDGGRGLGYGDAAAEGVNNDVFSSYRAMRSQGYHSGITTRSIKTRK